MQLTRIYYRATDRYTGNMSNLHMKPGDKFWEWTVIDPGIRITGTNRTHAAALARCSCGVEKVIHQHHLRSGNTKSCGHYRDSGTWRLVRPKRFHVMVKLRIKVNPELGHDRAVIRNLWRGIKRRCYNLNSSGYPNYGGRGVTLWEPWVNDSEAFVSWVLENLGPRPDNPPGWDSSSTYWSIDRIDNDRGYEPGNIRKRWATPSEQSRNQRPREVQTGRAGNVTGYIGVRPTPGASTFWFQLGYRGRNYYGCGFRTAAEASEARAAKIAELKELERKPKHRTVEVRAA